MNLANAPYGASAAMIERRSFDGSVAVIPISYTEREFSMAKSRSEVLASLRGIFADGEGKPEPKAKASKPAVAAAATATFGRFRKADKVEPVAEEPEQEDEVEEEESEDGDADSNHTSNGEADDVEVAPVEELLDRVESLIDYIADNSEALKSWIATCR